MDDKVVAGDSAVLHQCLLRNPLEADMSPDWDLLRLRGSLSDVPTELSLTAIHVASGPFS